MTWATATTLIVTQGWTHPSLLSFHSSSLRGWGIGGSGHHLCSATSYPCHILVSEWVENANKRDVCICKMQAIRTSSKIFWLFLHHLIERELLIMNIYFLALVNTFFRLKNTKNLKDVDFVKKHVFFKICFIFRFVFFLSFWNYFFQIQHAKLSRNKLLNRLKSENSIGGGTSNCIEYTTYRSIF